jgi:gluconolactonase
MSRSLPIMSRRSVLTAAGAFATTAAFGSQPMPSVRRLSSKLDRIITADSIPETIATGIRWAEGPVWMPGTGLLFSDPPANVIRRWTRRDRTTPFLYPSGAAGTDPKLVREAGSNGLARAHDGALLIANSGGRSIDRLDMATRRRNVLVGRYRGKRFNSPNDLIVARDGAIWFTDPPYGLAGGDDSPLRELPVNGVYRWMAGKEAILIDGSLSRPNGIALSPNERRLYVSVSDEAAPRIMVYDLDARGRPMNARVWMDAAPLQVGGAPGLPDGMKVARDGTLFCSVPGGMMILTPEAEPLGLIAAGSAIANCAFGERGSTLFLTASDRILRLPLIPGSWG